MPPKDPRTEQLLLLGCAFFAVRLYRGLAQFNATAEEYQKVRERAAAASIADAYALLDAAERAGLP